MNENLKENLLRLLMLLLYWALCVAGTAAGILVFTIGKTATGEHTGSGFLPSEIIKIQPVWAVIGILLASAVVTAVWFLLMRKSFLSLRGQHWGWYAAWILLFFAGAFLHFMAELFVLLYLVGLFSTLRPEWTVGLLIVPMFLPVLYFVGFLLIRLIRQPAREGDLS